MQKKAAEHKILPLFTFPNGFVLFPICNLLCRARRTLRTCGTLWTCRTRRTRRAALAGGTLGTGGTCGTHRAAQDGHLRIGAAAAAGLAGAAAFAAAGKSDMIVHVVFPLFFKVSK